MPRSWSFRPHDPNAIDRLSKQLKLSPLVAQVLLARGLNTEAASRSFLSSQLSQLFEPAELPGVNEAADRIVQAIEVKRQITIYGDYDVDGVTATSVLWHCFSLAGASVDYYIPSRVTEGYGLNTDAIRTLHEENPDRLLISVDCGIASVAEAEVASQLGLELIITDHHTIGSQLSNAACLVHPRLTNTDYPFGELCGVGVAFKLAWAVCQRLGDGKKASPRMREYLKSAVGLTAIGTVADVVPLVEENRVLVRYGLRSMRENPPLGLQALMKVSKLDDKPQLSAEDIGFGLAPRINAAGRLGQARLAVELLTTSNPERAIALADYVDELNNNRKTVERRIFKAAKEMVADHPDWEQHPTLVLAHHDWHPGVIGIVASRVAEHFEKPAVLIALRDDGTGQGSGRSWAGFDLYSGLEAASKTLLRFGGHKAAAGVRVEASRVEEFRTTLANWTAANFSPNESDLALNLDAEVLLSEVTRRAVDELNHLGPFGEANPSPRFASSKVELVEPPRTMGEGDRHLSIRVRQHRTVMRAVAFGKGEWAEDIAAVNGPLSICFAAVVNSFRGFEKVELRLIDWKAAS